MLNARFNGNNLFFLWPNAGGPGFEPTSRQFVELHKAETFEGSSTDWDCTLRQLQSCIISWSFHFLALGKIVIAGGGGPSANTVEVVDVLSDSNTCNNLPNLPFNFTSEFFTLTYSAKIN